MGVRINLNREMKEMFPMMLVLSLACTLDAHDCYLMQLPPIYPLSAISYVPHVGQCPIHAPSTCTMGLDLYARHSLFGRTDPYYTVIFFSSCGFRRPAATLALPFSVIVLTHQYLGALSGLPVSFSYLIQ